MADSKLSAIATKVSALTKAFRFYPADTSNAVKYSDLDQLASWLNGFRMVRIAAQRTLTSQTAAQAIFDSANDTLTVTTGTYLFEGLISLANMSATSGNAMISLTGLGNATVSDVLFYAVGIDGNAATAATQTGSTAITANSPASIVTAGAAAQMTARIHGSFEVTANGTLTPSISLVTAAAANVRAGSFMRFQRVGDTNFQASEDWS